MGTFFTREDIEATTTTAAYELLRRVNGARIHRNPYARDVKLDVRFARCGVSNLGAGGKGGPPVAVFIDGLQISKAGAMIALDELMTTEVEAMEVYVGPSQLPLEAMGDACAAVYVWTRFSSGQKNPP